MKDTIRNIRGFSWNHRDIIGISLTYALFAIGGALYQGAIPIIATESFLLTSFQASLLIVLTGIIYILTDGPIGILVDRIGSRNSAFLGLVSAVATGLLSITIPSLPIFTIGLVFFALSWNILSISTSAYILHISNREVSGRLFGIQGSIFVLGNVIGALGVGHVSAGGLAYAGFAFVSTSVLAAIVLFVTNPRGDMMKSQLITPAFNWNIFQWNKGLKVMRDFAPVSWISALNGFINYTFGSAMWLVIPLSLTKLSNSLIPEGTALGVFQISGIATILVGGYLADTYRRKKLFITFLLIETIGTILLGLTSNVFLFLSLAFVTMAALDAAQPVLNSMLADVNKGKDNEGTVEGFIGTLSDFGFIAGPLIGGMLFKQFGLQGVFTTLGVIMFLNWIAAQVMLRKYDPRA